MALQPFQPGDPHYSGVRMVEIRTIPDSAPYSAAPALYVPGSVCDKRFQPHYTGHAHYITRTI